MDCEKAQGLSDRWSTRPGCAIIKRLVGTAQSEPWLQARWKPSTAGDFRKGLTRRNTENDGLKKHLRKITIITHQYTHTVKQLFFLNSMGYIILGILIDIIYPTKKHPRSPRYVPGSSTCRPWGCMARTWHHGVSRFFTTRLGLNPVVHDERRRMQHF